jgi:hypothetical protein
MEQVIGVHLLFFVFFEEITYALTIWNEKYDRAVINRLLGKNTGRAKISGSHTHQGCSCFHDKLCSVNRLVSESSGASEKCGMINFSLGKEEE